MTTGQPQPLETVIWYPAVPGTGTLEPNINVLRDAVVLNRRWPLVMFSHGACSILVQSLFFTEGLASWGFGLGEPGLRLTLDVGHAHLTEESAPAAIRQCAPEIVNVHLEGMRHDRHEHLLPGEGDLDLVAVVSALREIDYRGPANLELSRHGHMAVEAARRAIEFRPLGLP